MSLSRADRHLVALLRGCALLAAAIVLLILLFLVKESWPVLRHVPLTRFITDASWHPVQGLYQLTPMLSATLYSTLGAVLLATPLGIGSALFSRYYAPGICRRLLSSSDRITGRHSIRGLRFLGINHVGAVNRSFASARRQSVDRNTDIDADDSADRGIDRRCGIGCCAGRLYSRRELLWVCRVGV